MANESCRQRQHSIFFVNSSLRIHFYVHHVHEVGTYFRYHNLAIDLTRLGHEVIVYAGDQNFRIKVRWKTQDGVRYHIEPGNACDVVFEARRP
jgi:hypothetical protein